MVSQIEQNIKKELTEMFIDSENPKSPYFEVVMDVMQFMNDFVGDPHTVELIFASINNGLLSWQRLRYKNYVIRAQLVITSL